MKKQKIEAMRIFAEQRRDDPSNKATVTTYWVGYIDALDAVEKALEMQVA